MADVKIGDASHAEDTQLALTDKIPFEDAVTGEFKWVAAQNIVPSGAPLWFEQIARTTLTVAGDTITVSGIPARKYLQLRIKLRGAGGTIDGSYRFNGDSATNYAFAIAIHDGNAYSNVASSNAMPTETGTVNGNDYEYIIADIVNIASEVKAVSQRTMEYTVAASVPPIPTDIWGTWVNTTSQINSIVLTNAGTGDFAIGSEIIVLGHD